MSDVGKTTARDVPGMGSSREQIESQSLRTDAASSTSSGSKRHRGSLNELISVVSQKSKGPPQDEARFVEADSGLQPSLERSDKQILEAQTANVQAIQVCSHSDISGSLTPLESVEDVPVLALLRQEWLAWHHRRFVLAIGEQGSLRGDSKSARACRKDGLGPGLQGMHARIVSNQSLSAQTCIDPLLPYLASSEDRQVQEELMDLGLSLSQAQALLVSLCSDMSKASLNCAQVQKEMEKSKPSSNGGSLYFIEPNNQFLLLVFEPELALMKEYLEPVRSSASLPHDRRFGRTHLPLYQRQYDKLLAVSGHQVSPFTSVIRINISHAQKLALLYMMCQNGVTDPESLRRPLPLFKTILGDDVFLRRMYCVVARYETLAGNVSGLQGALPHHVFDSLEQVIGVGEECFASPLNCHFPRYYSANPDTDRFFGSQGSYFKDFLRAEGCFEANPPFIVSTIDKTVARIDMALGKAQAAGLSLIFFIVVPSWNTATFHMDLMASKYCRANAQLKRKEHDYIDGMQHRADRQTWSANTETTWFVLATDAGLSQLHSGDEKWVNKLRVCFTSTHDLPSRVFKYAVGESAECEKGAD